MRSAGESLVGLEGSLQNCCSRIEEPISSKTCSHTAQFHGSMRIDGVDFSPMIAIHQ